MTLNTAMLEFEVLTACPICGGTDIPQLLSIMDLGIGSMYCNCQRCGQLFLNPRMTDEQTTRYYAGMYRDGLTDNIPRFMERDTFLQQSRAAAQIPFIKPYTQTLGLFKMLDVGCSLGYLLNGLAVYGGEADGVEPDTRYHSYSPANKFDMFASVDNLPDRTYDIITLSHSLEHLNHPREFMADLLAKHAHADTIVMVDVPNTETHRGSFRIHHPYAFTPFTLTGLFEMIGWRLVSMHYYGLAQEGPERKYMIGFFKRGS
jgi:SAM-dependent methyltransferase